MYPTMTQQRHVGIVALHLGLGSAPAGLHIRSSRETAWIAGEAVRCSSKVKGREGLDWEGSPLMITGVLVSVLQVKKIAAGRIKTAS